MRLFVIPIILNFCVTIATRAIGGIIYIFPIIYTNKIHTVVQNKNYKYFYELKIFKKYHN